MTNNLIANWHAASGDLIARSLESESRLQALEIEAREDSQIKDRAIALLLDIERARREIRIALSK